MSSYNIGAYSILLSQPQELYRELRLRYRSLARNLEASFCDRYESIISQKGREITNIERVSAEYVNRMVDYAIRDLVRHDIPDIDDMELLSKYMQTHMTWNSDIIDIKQRYTDILESALEDSAVKSNSSSPAFFGGGFGVEGAAAGIAISTAANSALRVTLGLTEKMAVGLTQFAAGLNMRAFFQAESTQAILSGAVYQLLFNIHYTVVDILSDKVAIETISKEDERRSDAIVVNIGRGRVPNDAVERYLWEAIRLHPFNGSAYTLWREKGLLVNDDFVNLERLFEIDVLDDASGSGSTKGSPSEESWDLKSLTLGILDILKGHPSKDFLVGNAISARKESAAREHYFRAGGFDRILQNENERHKGFPGQLLGLVDSTIFGSAEKGMAISDIGVFWRDEAGTRCVTWEKIISENIEIERQLLGGIKIGELGFSMAGSDMAGKELQAVLKEIVAYIRDSQFLTK